MLYLGASSQNRGSYRYTLPSDSFLGVEEWVGYLLGLSGRFRLRATPRDSIIGCLIEDSHCPRGFTLVTTRYFLLRITGGSASLFVLHVWTYICWTRIETPMLDFLEDSHCLEGFTLAPPRHFLLRITGELVSVIALETLI